MTDYLQRGIVTVQQAIEADQAGKMHEAFSLYMKSFEWFEMVIKYEKNPKMVESVREKMKGYLDRAETLKKNMEESRPVVEAPMASSSSSDSYMKALEGAIVTSIPTVTWDDVAGLEAAKDALKESVILPMQIPSLFEETQVTPWKAILLYGPPGTGKSHLAKAVAHEAKMTFISVSAAELVSKWVGESEKLVKSLFEMARARAPSIIFLDEVDSLCAAREDSSGGGNSEASNRIKTQFLIQMQGMENDGERDGVFVLGATNIPWALDQAMRRRFQRRIYIPLPNVAGRLQLFALHTKGRLEKKQLKKLASLTEGYSGHDVAMICKDAMMEPIRVVQSSTHFKRHVDGRFIPCSPGDEEAMAMTWEQAGSQVAAPPMRFEYFLKSLQTTKPSVNEADLHMHIQWTTEFGIEGQ